MHILFLINSMQAGGAERVTANLANHWSARGHRITIASFVGAETDAYPLDPAVRRIALGGGGASGSAAAALVSNLARVRAVRRCLARTRPDVAIGMMSTAACLLGLAGGAHVGRRIGAEHIHPPMAPLGRAWALIRRHAYARLDAVTALTPDGAAWLRRETRARRVVTLPNPVMHPLEPGVPRLVPGDHVRPHRRLLLSAGRLADQKGFDRLIAAFTRLAPDHPDWDLAILGEGPLRDALAALGARAGPGRVVLPGRAGNIGEWYGAADVFAMTSIYEGFPMTLLEAMAHGLPVVSVDCETGPRDIIRPGLDGLLVPQDDPDALCAALTGLMADADRRRALGGAAREVRERFSIDRIAAEWETLFR